MAGDHVIEVNERTFEAAVLEESTRRPVIVDFWAPWCGPCRLLGPILERLAQEGEGRWLLAKLNTDESPRLGRQYAIRSIPAVKAFQDKEVVDEFVGALPEREVKRWLERVVPSPAKGRAEEARAMFAKGDVAGAEAAAKEALAADPLNGLASLVLAEVAASRKAYDEAARYIEQAKLAREVAPDAEKLLARITFEQMSAVDAAKADGPDAALARAARDASEGRASAAFDEAIRILRNHRNSHGEKARELAVKVLALLPPEEAREKRRALSMALH